MGPDKFLHGRILFLDRLFTWIRANSVAVWLQWCSHGSVQSLDQSRQLIPGHNRAIWATSCTVRVFTRVRTNMEPCRSKSWPVFFRPQTCTLRCSKIRPVPPVPCKHKVELWKFLSVQRFFRTRVNEASVSVDGSFLSMRRSQGVDERLQERVRVEWGRKITYL